MIDNNLTQTRRQKQAYLSGYARAQVVIEGASEGVWIDAPVALMSLLSQTDPQEEKFVVGGFVNSLANKIVSLMRDNSRLESTLRRVEGSCDDH